jgi:hypothetical protein
LTGSTGCGKLSAWGERVRAMILAKPLKSKELRLRPASETATNTYPGQVRETTSLEHSQDHIDTGSIDRGRENKKNKVRILMRGKVFETTILFIVNNTGGIDAWSVNELIKEFAQLHAMRYDFSQSNVSCILKQLYDKELIDRFQFEKKFYYFQKGLR